MCVLLIMCVINVCNIIINEEILLIIINDNINV